MAGGSRCLAARRADHLLAFFKGENDLSKMHDGAPEPPPPPSHRRRHQPAGRHLIGV